MALDEGDRDQDEAEASSAATDAKSRGLAWRQRAGKSLFAQAQIFWVAVVGGLVGAVAALAVNHYEPSISNFLFGATRDVSAQIDSIERQAFRSNLYPLVARRVVLHGDTPSLLLVLRSRNTDPLAGPQRSDELRIYDVVRGKLTRRFEYLPEAIWGQLPWVLRLDAAGNQSENGSAVVVGSYAEYPVDVPFGPRPFIINWNSVAGRYVLDPVIVKPPVLPPPVGGYASDVRRETLRDPPWIDAYSHLPFRGYGVNDYEIDTISESLTMIGGYDQRQAVHALEPSYVIVAWRMRLDLPTPETDQCDYPPGLTKLRSNLTPSLLRPALAAAWRMRTRAQSLYGC